MKLNLAKGVLKKVAKGTGKGVLKVAKEVGEEGAEQGVKQIIKRSPKHVKKMAHYAADEAGNTVKKNIKTMSGDPNKWSKVKSRIKDLKKKGWQKDLKDIQDTYNEGLFNQDEARELVEGIYSDYYSNYSQDKEEKIMKELESGRKKYNKNKNKDSRRQQNKNNNQNNGRNQDGTIDMEQFKTADEIEAEMNNQGPDTETNEFNANDFNTDNSNSNSNESNRTYQTEPKDPDARYTNVDREGYTYQSKNGLVDEITDKETGKTYKYIRDKDGNIQGVKNVNDRYETVSDEVRAKLDDISKYERHEMEKNFTDKDWDDAFREFQEYEHSFDSEGKAISSVKDKADAKGHYGYNSADEVLARRKAILDEEITGIDKTIEGLDKKADKEQIQELLERQKKLQSKKAGIEYREARRADETAYEKMSNELKEKFTKQVEGMDPAGEAYKEAAEELAKNQEIIETAMENSRNSLKQQTQGKVAAFMDDTNWFSKLNKGINTVFTVKSAVDKYKESRAEGRSVASSLVRGAGSAVTSSMLGPWGSAGVSLAAMAPGAIIGAADYVLSEHRRMNSAANYTPLGGVSFQDSQQLATMRQSGMELAKMSRYNLEQSLMGAEAKHLHR